MNTTEVYVLVDQLARMVCYFSSSQIAPFVVAQIRPESVEDRSATLCIDIDVLPYPQLNRFIREPDWYVTIVAQKH